MRRAAQFLGAQFCGRSARAILRRAAATADALHRYAKRSGAELHVVDSLGHPSFADWNRTVARRANSGTPVNSHFLKLPMLQWFLQRFDRVLFLGTP